MLVCFIIIKHIYNIRVNFMTISTAPYPLALENWGEDHYCVISRGHHDLATFEAEVRKEFDSWGDFFESAYHSYFKATPRDGYRAWYTECSPNTRGAFPATVASEGWLKKFGTNSWDRHKFTMEQIVVPVHDMFGSNPPTEICKTYNASQGETFRAKHTVGENVWHMREVNDYRPATDEEARLGHRI